MLLTTGEQVSIALMTMALHCHGIDAVSMTGAQLGIITDEFHTRARIRSIDTTALEAELDRGRVIVVAGFQGMSSAGQLTRRRGVHSPVCRAGCCRPVQREPGRGRGLGDGGHHR